MIKYFFFIYFILISARCYCDESFVLLTTLYDEKNEARQEEFSTCLKYNITHPLIKKIVIFYESKERQNFLKKLKELDFFDKKVDVIFISKRPTFEMFFNFANLFYPEEKIIISNADIYFDDTLGLIEKNQLINKLIALTRYDQGPNGQYTLHDAGSVVSPCQDSWIFLAPIKSFFSDITLGILGCDPSIAYSALKAHLKVMNPCLSIKSYHMHSSNIRTYTVADNYNEKLPFASLRMTRWPLNKNPNK